MGAIHKKRQIFLRGRYVRNIPMGTEANGMDFFHRFGGLHRYKGLLLQPCRDMGFISGVFGQGGKFENQQCSLIEVYDHSSGQQRPLCVNLEEAGRGFGTPQSCGGLEDGGYYQVAGASVQWFGEG